MQINRSNNLLFLPASPPQNAIKPAKAEATVVTSVPTPTPVPDEVVVAPAVASAPPEAAVTYSRTGQVEKKYTTPAELTNLSDMTLSNQLEVGKKMGVFTKITLSKDGVLVAKPDLSRAVNSPEFVAAAVTTIKDFQEGIAALKENSPQANSKASALLSGSLRNLQNVAARFHVFA